MSSITWRAIAVMATHLALAAPAGADVSSVPSNPAAMTEIERAAAHIQEEEFVQARELLKTVVEREPDDADGWSLFGFASRKTGDLPGAQVAYARALALDPLHVGANEYAGEMWLEMGEVDRARQNLEALIAACPGGCEGRSELEALLAAR